MIVILTDFIVNIFVNDRYSMTPLNFISFRIFIDSPDKSIGMSIYVLIGSIVSKVVSNEKISHFLDRVRPSEPELIVSFVEFGLEWPLKVKEKVVIFFERRSIPYLSTKSSCPMFVNILLNGSENGTFLLRFNVNTRVILGIFHTFKSFFDDELILFVDQLP